jgi:multiple sugar transport system substrate-binding protein
MKLKKAGALGLSCVIALGSMAGCGSSKEKEKTDGKEEISGEIRYAF